jgi:drug/metabolite transporter (DMT)-like permease
MALKRATGPRGPQPMTRLRAMSGPAQGHLAMLLFSALVAGSFALGGQIANEIAPAALTAVRFGIAGGIVGLVAWATGGLSRDLLRAPWRFALLGGVFAVYFVLMFEGLKTADPVSTAAVFTLTPVMAAGFGWILMRQVTTPRMALALSVGAAGALWVIFDASLAAFLAFDIGRGEAIFFVGCVAHALYAPMARHLNRGESTAGFAFGILTAGCVLLFLYGWRDVQATDWASLRPLVWITLGYLTLGASAATIVLLQTATLRLPSAKVMAYTYLVPSWVILWQIALGAAVPDPWVLVGVGLTCLALVLLLKPETPGG